MADVENKKDAGDKHSGEKGGELAKGDVEANVRAHRAALKANPDQTHTVNKDGKGKSFELTDKGKLIASKESTANAFYDKHLEKTEAPKQAHKPDNISGAYAQQLHDALHQKNFVGWPDPDVTKIEHLLSALKTPEKQALESAYEKMFGPLKEDFSKVLGADSQNFALASSALGRREGVTDALGHLKVAIAQIKEGKDQSHGEADLRHTIAEMPEALLKNFRTDAMAQQLMREPHLTEATRDAIAIMLIPNWRHRPDLVKELANGGVQSKRMDIFEDAMRYADPTARAAFRKSSDGQTLLHSPDENLSKLAREYMNTGQAGLESSLLSNLSWIGKNKEGIHLAVEQASKEERDAYVGGEKAIHKQNPSITEAKNIQIYKDLDSAMHRASDTKREYELLRAKLDGQHPFVVNLLETHNDSWIGGGHDIRKVHQVVENMGEQDWKALRSRPEYMIRVDHALSTFMQPAEKLEVLKAIQEKVGNPNDKTDSFVKAQERGNRSIEQVLAQNKKGILDAFSGFNDKDKDVLDRLSKMNSAERSKIDAKYTQKIEHECQSDLARAIAHRILERAQNGKSAHFDKVEIAAMSTLQPATPLEKIKVLESALQSPANRKLVEHPSTDSEQVIAKAIGHVLNSAIDEAGFGDQSHADGMGMPVYKEGEYERFSKDLLKTGHMPLALKYELASHKLSVDDILGSGVKDRFDLMEIAPKGSAKDLQQKIFATPEIKQVIVDALNYQALNSSDLKTESFARAFKLDLGIKETDLLDRIRALTPEQLKDVSAKYAQNYHSSLQADVMSRVSPAHRNEFGDALFTKPVWQKILDGRVHTADINNFLASSQQMDEASNRVSKLFADHRDEISKLSKSDQVLLSDALSKYQRAEQEYIKTKGKNAEQFVDASTTAMAVVGSLINPAVSLEMIAGSGVAGAAYRYASLKSLLGKDFDNSPDNVKRQLFEGFATASLCMFGPENLGLNGMFKVGEKAAAKVASETAAAAKTQLSEGILKSGGEEIIKKGMAGLPEKSVFIQDAAYLQSIHAIAKQAVREGARPEEIAALERLIQARGNSSVKDGVHARLKHELRDLLRSTATGSIANVGGEVGATVVGVKPQDTLSQRALESAVSGALGAAIGHGVFSSGLEVSRTIANKLHADKVLREAQFKPTTFESKDSRVLWDALEQNRVEIKPSLAKEKSFVVEDAGRKRAMHPNEKLPIETKLWVNGEVAALNLDGKVISAKTEKQNLLNAAHERFKNANGSEGLSDRGDRFIKMVSEVDKVVPDVREQARIHYELNRLLADHKTSELGLDDRIWLAEQSTKEIIDSHRIVQSGYTCNVTGIEQSMAREQPGDFLRVIAAGAIEGRLRLSNGHFIVGRNVDACHIDLENSLAKKRSWILPEPGNCSLASRIFQQYAVESHWVFRDQLVFNGRVLKGTPGEFKFAQNGMDTLMHQDGKPLIEMKNGAKYVEISPGIGTEHLQSIWEQLSGRHSLAPLVALKDAPRAAQHKGQVLLKSEAHFSKIVEEAARTHRPILLGVDVSLESVQKYYKSRRFAPNQENGPVGHLFVGSSEFDKTGTQLRIKIFDPAHSMKEGLSVTPKEAWQWLLRESPGVNKN